MGGIRASSVGKRTIFLTIVTVIISLVVSLSCLTGTALAEAEVGGGTSVTLQGEIGRYTVTFVDWDGTVVDTQIVEHGASVVAPVAPTHDGYTFTGWDKDFSKVTNDLVVIAQYKINSYTVTFIDHDGTALDSQAVKWSEGAKAPLKPTREGYIFTSWDKDFSRITSDLTVTAQYKPEPSQPPGGGGAGGGIIPQTGDLEGLILYILVGSVLLIIIGACLLVLLKCKKEEGGEQ